MVRNVLNPEFLWHPPKTGLGLFVCHAFIANASGRAVPSHGDA